MAAALDKLARQKLHEGLVYRIPGLQEHDISLNTAAADHVVITINHAAATPEVMQQFAHGVQFGIMQLPEVPVVNGVTVTVPMPPEKFTEAIINDPEAYIQLTAGENFRGRPGTIYG